MNNDNPITEIRSLGYADPELNANLQANADNTASSYMHLKQQYERAREKLRALSFEPTQNDDEIDAAAAEVEALKQQLHGMAQTVSKRFPYMGGKQ